MEVEEGRSTSGPERQGTRQRTAQRVGQNREVHGFIGRQTARDLGQILVAKSWNHTEVGVDGAEFQAGGQVQHIVLVAQGAATADSVPVRPMNRRRDGVKGEVAGD